MEEPLLFITRPSSSGRSSQRKSFDEIFPPLQGHCRPLTLCTNFSWFRQTKFASFQRQLNLYGFKRLTTGKKTPRALATLRMCPYASTTDSIFNEMTGRDKNGYYHELFLRGKRFLAHRIPRIKLKGQGARKPTSPETEPNFYLYSFLPMEQSNDRNGEAPQAVATGRGSMRHPALSLEQILLSNAAGGPFSCQLGGEVPSIGQLTSQLALPHRSLFQEVLAASLTQGDRMFMDHPRDSMMHQGRLPLPSMAPSIGSIGSTQQPYLNPMAFCSQQHSASMARAPPALSDLLNADLALRMALARDGRSSVNISGNSMK